ncbi:MAG TPA: LysR family transcriptional regulator, partial [Paracoccaceae bacterium]|nr:LysR family transcriptional regulator [Paracoccaceae bacterium]
MKITLRQLQYLKAVVEHGNFSRAAERLGTSQPALSLAVREMEEALGLRLFDRTTRRVTLTDAGRVFWTAAVACLSEIERGLADLENLAALREGSVTLLATPLLAATLLPAVVDRVRRAHPGLQLRIGDESTDRILAMVRQGRADLGLGTFREGEEGIRSAPVLTDDLMAFVGAMHPLAGRTMVGWRELAQCRIAAMAPESGLRFLADDQFDRLGLRVIPAVEVHQVYTA